MGQYHQRMRRYVALMLFGFLVCTAHLFFLNPDQSHTAASLALLLFGAFGTSLVMFRMTRCYPTPVPPPYAWTTAENILFHSGIFVVLVSSGFIRGETPWNAAPCWLMIAGMATTFGTGWYATFLKRKPTTPSSEQHE